MEPSKDSIVRNRSDSYSILSINTTFHSFSNEAVEKANHDPISTHLKFNFYPLTIGYELAAGKLFISLFQFRAINRFTYELTGMFRIVRIQAFTACHAVSSP
ncbi:hypothetical protein OLMES_3964 [Oleiphilus messinensis]|uniref:Uncharacterized protein n=1 Tax=Oleiphilus messinensis TaxID=141451 RepID=A0A1Y0IF29_9GAMM|nr:hypothetical protein OLMES_3964 [Oleiphilus messinensis]